MREQIPKILFAAGVLLCLAQIWLPFCFLTGDGPCHVYNAQILHDSWNHIKGAGLYNSFFAQVGHPNPNWTTHLLLSMLMFVVNGITAEKILLTAYVLLFVFGFAALLKKLAADNYILLSVFLFVINHILLKGFYNFSLGVAVFFWLVLIWMRYLENQKRTHLAVLFFLSLISFFTHPLTFALGFGTCCALSFSQSMAEGVRKLSVRLLLLCLCFLPGLALFFKFAGAEGTSGTFHLHAGRYRAYELLYNLNLIDYTTKEEIPAKIAAVLIALFFALPMIDRWRMGIKMNKNDGWILMSAIVLFIYLCFPDTMFGGSLLALRTRFFFYLLLVCCSAAFIRSNRMKMVAGVSFFALFLVFTLIRMPIAMAAGNATMDNISVADSIRPYAIVLPLNFNKNGKDAGGKAIADANWLFCHQEQYVGIRKPLIFMDNYEANTGYFPLVWREQVNPYYYLGKNGTFENAPPSADIAGYRKTSGVTIDYIITFCFDSSCLRDQGCSKLYRQVITGYHIIYRSPAGQTVLFAKN